MKNINKTGRLSIETDNIFPIIRQWLYSDQDIFIRELISNACDAINKRLSLVRMGEVEGEFEPKIEVLLDENAGVLSFTDNGLGMTGEEIDKYINQIAFSGAVDFINKYKEDSAGAEGIIGHFGLGFYSAFMPADKVEITSLSCYKDSESAYWYSEDGVTFNLTAADKETVGTTITVTLSEEGKKMVTADFVRRTLLKYCYFMPYPIFFTTVAELEAKAKAEAEAEAEAEAKAKADKSEEANKPADSADKQEVEDVNVDKAPQPINNVAPLWLKKAGECTDEDYVAFYQETFHDYKKPLFWIHLNMDYPFNLKGILYFPQYEEKLATLDGRIKLYNNQVFVADNIKEVIPDFLFLLRGCLDCPDLPLNVSRSFLQHDSYVQKLSTHIVKKVADKLTEIFRKDRAAYEDAWTSIATFVKYGMMRDEKFYEKANSALIFRKTDDGWLTWSDAPQEIYYTVDKNRQAYYVDMVVNKGHDVVCLGEEIDTPFINFLEYKRNGTKFLAVDAEHNNDAGDDKILLDLQNVFAAYKDEVEFGVAGMGAEALPILILETEESKRAKQMKEMFKQMGQDVNDPSMANMFSGKNKLVFNTDNPLWRDLLKTDAEEQNEIAAHLYDLARLNYGDLQGAALTAFLQRSDKLLRKLTKSN